MIIPPSSDYQMQLIPFFSHRNDQQKEKPWIQKKKHDVRHGRYWQCQKIRLFFRVKFKKNKKQNMRIRIQSKKKPEEK